MKKQNLFFFIFLIFYLTISDTQGQSNNMLEDRLVKYCYQAKNSPDSNLYKIRFFHVFPDNFYLFESLYGYDECFGKYWIDSLTYHSLFDVAIEHIDLLFDCANLIEQNRFCRKLINLSINGYAQVDAIAIFLYNLQRYIDENKNFFFNVLNDYADADIKSFWHFYYDVWNYGSHHPGEKYEYNNMYEMIEKLSNVDRILNLMEKQYNDDYNHYMYLIKKLEIEKH